MEFKLTILLGLHKAVKNYKSKSITVILFVRWSLGENCLIGIHNIPLLFIDMNF